MAILSLSARRSPKLSLSFAISATPHTPAKPNSSTQPAASRNSAPAAKKPPHLLQRNVQLNENRYLHEQEEKDYNRSSPFWFWKGAMFELLEFKDRHPTMFALLLGALVTAVFVFGILPVIVNKTMEIWTLVQKIWQEFLRPEPEGQTQEEPNEGYKCTPLYSPSKGKPPCPEKNMRFRFRGTVFVCSPNRSSLTRQGKRECRSLAFPFRLRPNFPIVRFNNVFRDMEP